MNDGEPSYKPRTVEITFGIIGDTLSEMFNKRVSVIKWLTSERGGTMELSRLPWWHFRNVTATIDTNFNRKREKLSLLPVTFTADPYIVSEDLTSIQNWDDFDFETGYLNLPEYEAEQSEDGATYYYYNPFDFSIQPAVTATKVSMGFWLNGKAVNVEPGSYTKKIQGLVFASGVNTIRLVGSGSLKFEAVVEAL
jgi:hypothetical protein